MNIEEKIKRIEEDIEKIKEKLGIKEKTFESLNDALDMAEKYINKYYRGFMHELKEGFVFHSKRYALMIYKIDMGGKMRRLLLILNSEQGVVDEFEEPWFERDEKR